MSETRADNLVVDIDTRADSLTVDIDMMLRGLSLTPSKPSIFRVGDRLRSINPEAYNPRIIAIGPFHRSKRNLQKMELHKARYLKLFLQRINETSAERCVTAILPLVDRARKCYEEVINLDEEEFLQMSIFDSCFIIEFLYLYQHEECGYEGNPIFQHKHIQRHLLHDLLLFENQIPFFIVECLFNMIEFKNGDNIINSLIYPLLHFSIFPVPREDLPEVLPVNALHLLGVVHDIQCSSFATVVSPMDAGNPGSPQKYVTDYVFFMHCLVRSPEDIKLLRLCGIIKNILGGDEMVYDVIKRLAKNIIVSEMFSYSNIFNTVNHHRRNKWNIRMATLRRNYLNGPRALISVFVATFLLVLIIPVTFAILSYRNDLKRGN